MRHGAWWTLVLLGLPRLAAADGATSPTAQPMSPGSQPAIESGETPAAIPRSGLDFGLDPTQWPASQNPPPPPQTIEPARADRYTDGDQPSTDRGLSFGVELRPRTQFGSRARQDAADAPGLRDDAERLMERSTIGVRGRYRF